MSDAIPQPRRRIVVLTSGGPLAWSVVNGLVERLGPVAVIEEQPETKGEIIRRRVRIAGPVAALGQVAFGLWQRLGASRAQDRIRRIRRATGLDPTPRPDLVVARVTSLNSMAAHDALARLDPEVVAVYGTRILSRATLGAVAAPFINYHAGINPKYRGQHPAYWALAAGDKDNAGITIHLVDEGVDTGGVLYQAPATFAPEDTIATYQTVQAAVAIPLFARAIEDALGGRLAPYTVAMPSAKNFPPTIWYYLFTGMTRGIW